MREREKKDRERQTDRQTDRYRERQGEKDIPRKIGILFIFKYKRSCNQ